MTEKQPQPLSLHGDWKSIPSLHRFAHQAMAAPFEIIIHHQDGQYASQAAAAAFNELDRLEADLSRFIENSDISRINNLAAHRPLRIGLPAFECLQLSKKISAQTSGAFDVTIGTLFNCWLNKDKSLRRPAKNRLNLARQHTGMHLLKLNRRQYTVELLKSPLQIDLGGIGKGYAADKMAKLLRRWTINIALISAGQSSVLALLAPPDTKGWPLTISHPDHRQKILSYLYLHQQAVSASGLQKGPHIIDPRTARPADRRPAAWAWAPDAATADALSTAFMIMTPDEIKKYCLHHPPIQATVILTETEKNRPQEKILRFGT